MLQEVRGAKLLLGYIGFFLIFIGAIILVPLLVLPFYPEEISEAKYFLAPGTSSIAAGFFIFLLIQGRKKGKLEGHEDIVLVVLVWVLAILVSAIPFLLTKKYNFTQAIFETTSGYTTTGLSVVDVSTCSHVFLFYRSFLQFVGGIGLVLIVTSAVSDRRGIGLYMLEGHNDRLLPNLVKSARLIFAIYFLYMGIGILLYLATGVNFFEAICHSMTALSTGGFSTRAGSVRDFQSLSFEIVTMVLMLLGSTNFVIHYFLLRGKFITAFRHYEFGVFVLLMGTIFPLMVGCFAAQYQSFWLGLRYGSFEFVSAITTSGFQVVESYNTVPPAVFFCIIVLMIIGGQSGSTSGGLKQSRVAQCLLNVKWYLEGLEKKSTTIRVRHIVRFGQKEVLSAEEIKSSCDFAALYLLILAIGTTVISATGVPFSQALFEFASSLGTVGLSTGVTAFNASPIVLWTEIIGMFLGRLEIVVVFVLIEKTIKLKNVWMTWNEKKAT
jgi:Trk-type K+ transport systems, membrane components